MEKLLLGLSHPHFERVKENEKILSTLITDIDFCNQLLFFLQGLSGFEENLEYLLFQGFRIVNQSITLHWSLHWDDCMRKRIAECFVSIVLSEKLNMQNTSMVQSGKVIGQLMMYMTGWIVSTAFVEKTWRNERVFAGCLIGLHDVFNVPVGVISIKQKKELSQRLETNKGTILEFLSCGYSQFKFNSSICRGVLDVVGALSNVYGMEFLLSQNVDTWIFQSLLDVPECKENGLNSLSLLVTRLVVRKVPCSTEYLERLCGNITTLSDMCFSKTSLDRETFSHQLQLALVIQDFLDGSSEYLSKLNSLCDIWRKCIINLVSHPSLTISSIGFSRAPLLINAIKVYDKCPPWFRVPEISGYIYIHMLRIGDPALYVMTIAVLQHLYGSGFPTDALLEKLKTVLFLGSAHSWAGSTEMNLIEDDLTVEDVTMEIREVQQKSNYNSRYANSKTSVSSSVYALWASPGWLRDSFISSMATIFHELEKFVSMVDCNKVAFQHQDVVNYITKVPDKIKPCLNPLYVIFDGVWSIIEVLGNKMKLSKEKNDFISSEGIDSILKGTIGMKFPKNDAKHYLEMRRLDFMSSCSTLFSSETLLLQALELAFFNATLSEENVAAPIPVFISGVVENWQDQEYLIRRKGIHCVIQFIMTYPIISLVEPIVANVESRLKATSLHESERSLLNEILITAAGTTKKFEIVVRFTNELLRPLKEILTSGDFQQLINNQDKLVERLFGLRHDENSPEFNEQLSDNRRALARVFSQLESIFKRDKVPQTTAELSAGDFIDTNRRSTNVKNPLDEHVVEMLPPILELCKSFISLWDNLVISRYPHLAVMLSMSMEEWKELVGSTAESGVTDLDLYKESESRAFPIPNNFDKACVRLTRRHAFHLRNLMFKNLGMFTTVLHGFYAGRADLIERLSTLSTKVITAAPINFVVSYVNLFLMRVLEEKTLVMLNNMQYPTMQFLEAFVCPLVPLFIDRISSTSATLLKFKSCELSVIDSSVISLQATALISLCKSLLVLFGNLIHAKHCAIIVHSLDTNYGIPTEMEVASFVQRLHQQKKLCGSIIELIQFMTKIPDPDVNSHSYRVLKVFCKQTSKMVDNSQELAEALIASILKNTVHCLTHITEFYQSTLCDTGTVALQNYITGRNNTLPETLSTSICSTVYESLRALYRLHAIRIASLSMQPSIDTVVLSPKLYESLELLTRVPFPLSTEDFEAFVGNLMKNKGEHDSKEAKDAIKIIWNLNTQHLNLQALEITKTQKKPLAPTNDMDVSLVCLFG